MAEQLLHPLHHDTPVEDDMALHNKGWVVQRIGWAFMFLFLLAALLGLFGEGPLSSRTVQAGHIKVEYERFCRYEHETEITLESNGEDISTVSLPQQYLKKFKVSKIVPEASKQVASPGYINYLFEGKQNNNITFYLEPVKRLNTSGVIKINNYSVFIKQTIYP